MHTHPALQRLDALALHLADDPDVRAVLGLGSTGVELERFDDHSDLDFFVVVADGEAKRRLLAEPGWLTGLGGRIAHHFANDPHSLKVFLDDGLFLELAVFTPDELAALRLAGVRVVWVAPGFALPPLAPPSPPTALDTVAFHVDECAANLYVGLQRELRGERLTAMRFIQVHAVDRVLALERLHPDTRLSRPDPFEPTRRVEHSHLAHALPLASMVPGYDHNASAARAVLEWLTTHHRVHPVVRSRIEALLARAAAERPPA